MIKIFVYGSLKKDFYNHEVLEDSTFVGNYKTKDYFKMIDFGSYPAIFFNKDGFRVMGELYEIDEDILRQLDYLEGYPKFYNRTEIELIDCEDKVLTYFLELEKFDEENLTLIEPHKGTLTWEDKSWKTLFR